MESQNVIYLNNLQKDSDSKQVIKFRKKFESISNSVSMPAHLHEINCFQPITHTHKELERSSKKPNHDINYDDKDPVDCNNDSLIREVLELDFRKKLSIYKDELKKCNKNINRLDVKYESIGLDLKIMKEKHVHFLVQRQSKDLKSKTQIISRNSIEKIQNKVRVFQKSALSSVSNCSSTFTGQNKENLKTESENRKKQKCNKEGRHIMHETCSSNSPKACELNVDNNLCNNNNKLQQFHRYNEPQQRVTTNKEYFDMIQQNSLEDEYSNQPNRPVEIQNSYANHQPKSQLTRRQSNTSFHLMKKSYEHSSEHTPHSKKSNSQSNINQNTKAVTSKTMSNMNHSASTEPSGSGDNYFNKQWFLNSGLGTQRTKESIKRKALPNASLIIMDSYNSNKKKKPNRLKNSSNSEIQSHVVCEPHDLGNILVTRRCNEPETNSSNKLHNLNKNQKSYASSMHLNEKSVTNPNDLYSSPKLHSINEFESHQVENKSNHTTNYGVKNNTITMTLGEIVKASQAMWGQYDYKKHKESQSNLPNNTIIKNDTRNTQRKGAYMHLETLLSKGSKIKIKEKYDRNKHNESEKNHIFNEPSDSKQSHNSRIKKTNNNVETNPQLLSLEKLILKLQHEHSQYQKTITQQQVCIQDYHDRCLKAQLVMQQQQEEISLSTQINKQLELEISNGMEELRSKIDLKLQEIALLPQMVRDEKHKYDQAAKANNTLINRMVSLQEEVVHLRKKVENLTKKKVITNQRLKAAERDLNIFRNYNTALKHEKKKLLAELQHLRDQFNSLKIIGKRTLARTREKNEKLIRELHKHVADLEQKLNRSQTTATGLLKERDNLITELQCQLNSLVHNFEVSQNHIRQLRRQISDITGRRPFK